MFEFVKCPVCGMDDYKVVYKSTVQDDSHLDARQMSIDHDIEHFQIVSCINCGTQYSNPRDSFDELSKNYRELDEKEYLNQMDERVLTFKENLKTIIKYKSEGYLLDIGCSVGLFLKAAEERMEVCGVEMSEKTSRYAREIFNLNVMTGEVGGKFEANSFDVVTMWDLIEHVPDPRSLLSEIGRILKGNGIICMSTPCVDGLLARLMGEKWVHYIRTHLTFFSSDTIFRILNEEGFELIEKKDYVRIFTIAYFVKRVIKYNRPFGLILRALIKVFCLENIRFPFNLKDTLFIIAQKKS